MAPYPSGSDTRSHDQTFFDGREQNADLQQDALRAAGRCKVLTDHVTGTRERPELDWLIEQAQAARHAGGVDGWTGRCGI